MIKVDRITKDMIYNMPSPETLTLKMNKIQEIVDEFLMRTNFKRSDIEFNDALIAKIAVRVDQRSDYFVYFHSTINENGNIIVDKMSEYKQEALLCFWLIKYKPFRIKNKETELVYYKHNHCTINEAIAAYIFVSHVVNSGNITKEQQEYYLSMDYLSDLFYKFMHHDISKEAMIFSLCSLVRCK